jgi:hypothetical protein
LQGKILAEKWKALTDEERKPYEDKSAKDKERYQKEMANYEVPEEFAKGSKGNPSSKKKPAAKGKKKRDPNEPKKPMSAFLLYSGEVRPQIKEENPDLSFGDTVSCCIFV